MSRLGKGLEVEGGVPRLPSSFNSSNPYHLSARSNNKDWFALPLAEVWDIMCRYLYFAHHAHGARIYGFVLMSNHFHLLASFPGETLTVAMQYFMRETSRCIARASSRINHVYGTRHFRSEINRLHYFYNVYKYVYRNPVEAGLSDTVETWRYSTLNGLLGLSHLSVPLAADDLLFNDLDGTLNWLNRAPCLSARSTMKKALRRGTFGYPIDRDTNDEHPLEIELY